MERLTTEDLRAGQVKSSWKPRVTHPSIPPELVDAFADRFLASVLLSISEGEWRVSDDWNCLLGNYKTQPAEEFLSKFWRDKP